MNQKDLRYFEVAKTLSYTSKVRYKIGAVVVVKHTIISVGVNSDKTHPTQKYYNQYRFNTFLYDTLHSLHAEIQALIKVPKDIDLSDATVYTYRENRAGSLAKSRPCKSCLQMIKDYGIAKNT